MPGGPDTGRGSGRGENEGDFLNTRRAAAYLDLSPRNLDGYRVNGEGPTFHRFGNRVRYRRTDPDAGRRSGAQPRMRRRTSSAVRNTDEELALGLHLRGGHDSPGVES